MLNMYITAVRYGWMTLESGMIPDIYHDAIRQELGLDEEHGN